MVVIAVVGGVIFSAYIDDGVTCRELSWVSGANKRRRGVGREQTKEIDSESLIGMEMAAGMDQ